MKKILTIIITISLPIFAYSKKPTYLGKIDFVEGKSFLTNLKTNKKTLIKKGLYIYKGFSIQTSKTGKVLIKLKNGILKFIPSNSKISFIDTQFLKKYKNTDNSIKRMVTTLGTKANNEEQWVDDDEDNFKNLVKLFKEKRYIKIIQKIESKKVNLDTPDKIFLAALTYLKVGYEPKSITHFKDLLKTKNFDYEERAYFGLFVNYLRQGSKKEKQKILELLNKKYPQKIYTKKANRIGTP